MKAGKGVFPLVIAAAQADIPGVITAVGNACFGKFYFAFAARSGAGVLLLAPKKSDDVLVWQTDKGAAPGKAPDVSTDPKAAVELYRAVQRAAPVERGEPAWYRGAWAGKLVCNDGAPVLTLERKVATYALLTITSTPTGAWKVTAATRPDKWFTGIKREAQTREEVVKGPLSEAMEHGYRMASATVAVACSTRDTTRRHALDKEFAAQHPPKPAKAPRVPKKDPVEAVGKRKGVKAADLPQLPAPTGKAPTAKAAGQLAADAKALVNTKGATLETMIKRAAKLVAHADALVRSDACTGDAQKQAQAALDKARAAFDRAAATAEADAGLARNLATVAQQTALVAARAGKACEGKAPAKKAAPARAPRSAKALDEGKQQQLGSLFANAIREAAAEMSA